MMTGKWYEDNRNNFVTSFCYDRYVCMKKIGVVIEKYEEKALTEGIEEIWRYTYRRVSPLYICMCEEDIKYWRLWEWYKYSVNE